jgi:hypothetical protein
MRRSHRAVEHRSRIAPLLPVSREVLTARFAILARLGFTHETLTEARVWGFRRGAHKPSEDLLVGTGRGWIHEFVLAEGDWALVMFRMIRMSPIVRVERPVGLRYITETLKMGLHGETRGVCIEGLYV